MKKLIALFSLFVITLFFNSCDYVEPPDVLDALPKYRNMVFYSEGFWQDFTQYGKYYYDDIDDEIFENTPFVKTTADDVENVLSYIENFESWIDACDDDSEIVKGYDFDKTIISEGDYLYLETEPIGDIDETYDKFEYYAIYYFDFDEEILYYICSKT